MSDQTKRPRTQLQPHEPTTEPKADALEHITDPVAREIYGKKLDLGIQDRLYIAALPPKEVCSTDEWGEW